MAVGVREAVVCPVFSKRQKSKDVEALCKSEGVRKVGGVDVNYRQYGRRRKPKVRFVRTVRQELI